jgi:hypothetical protein
VLENVQQLAGPLLAGFGFLAVDLAPRLVHILAKVVVLLSRFP